MAGAERQEELPKAPPMDEAMKESLHFAGQGGTELSGLGGDPDVSLFKKQVAVALALHGWQVRERVGCKGFAIYVAIVDPKDSGRCLLGAECDGSTYGKLLGWKGAAW